MLGLHRNLRRCIGTVVFAAVLFALTACGKEKANQTPKSTPAPGVSATPTPEEPAEDTTEPALRPEAKNIYQLAEPQQGDLCAEIEIEGYGILKVRLFSDDARKATENFKTLAENGNYNKIPVNRLVKDYMFQAGDREGMGLSGESIYGGGFENEISERIRPLRGSLCMANTGGTSTNTTQFFFVQTKANVVKSLRDPLDNRYHLTVPEYLKEAYGADVSEEELAIYELYGGAPWLYGNTTVFGQIYEGYEILDRMMDVKVTSRFKPNPTIWIKEVRIFHYGEQ